MGETVAIGIILSVVLIISGSLLLYFGAEGLVSGSSSVAFRFGITPIVIGLTIVAFGTSSPELVVSLSAALQGSGEIAVGNVVGSNICNIALILGIAAIIRPIGVDKRVVKTDIFVMLGVSILMAVLLLDGAVSRLDGILLAAGIIGYNWLTIYMAKKDKNAAPEEEFDEYIPKKKRNIFVDVFLIAGGLGVLVLGANFFLNGAVVIADYLGASEAIIGLTVVSFGTSLPELATSVVASMKKQGDIILGNAIGSNIFNVLCILGVTAAIHPLSTTEIDNIDLGVMIIIAAIIYPLARLGMTLSRWKGFVLLAFYFGYMYYLYLQLPASQ